MESSLYKNRFFEGVNFDYILAIKYNENKIEKHKIPINKNGMLIENMFQMVDDETYEADDIYYAFKRHYYDCGDFEYCLGHGSLLSFYIDSIRYPFFDEQKHRKQAQVYKKRIASAKNESARRWIQKDYNKWNHRKKIEYINKCLPYVFACNYHDAVVKNNIEKNYFIYSNETHGRFCYSSKINEDLEIKLKTNFCYGSSSSLVVIISYKGIPILPYSIWVNYYYAGFNEIIKCTRSYNPNRANWITCMDFVVWFVEKAIVNPEVFVKETIIQEVDGLVKGIEGLYSLTDEEMKKKLSISRPNDTLRDKYYIGIRTARMASKQEIQRYTISPEEITLVYRMEKITGALHFLNSLRKIQEIYDGVEQAINKIKEFNANFYPEIIKAIPPVKEYISELNNKLKPIEKNFSFIQKRYDLLEAKLRRRLDRTDLGKKEVVEIAFKKNNPQYTIMKDEIQELGQQIWDLKHKIRDRENYLHQLEDAQSLVKRHVVIDI